MERIGSGLGLGLEDELVQEVSELFGLWAMRIRRCGGM